MNMLYITNSYLLNMFPYTNNEDAFSIIFVTSGTCIKEKG